jgi:pimeloyl-ACP methyl ester carboxylesterase
MLGELLTISSTDGKPMDGILYRPSLTRDLKRGVLLVHGLTWNFYRGTVRHLAPHLTEAGYTCLALNMRDHDKADPVEFDLSYHDLQAGINWLWDYGVKEVILLAHGYACNKAIVFCDQSGAKGVDRYMLATVGSVKKYRPEIWDAVLAGASKMVGKVLVVQGALDSPIDAKQRAEELTAAAPGCSVEVIMLQGGDHNFVNKDRELADLLIDWCAKTVPQ